MSGLIKARSIYSTSKVYSITTYFKASGRPNVITIYDTTYNNEENLAFFTK